MTEKLAFGVEPNSRRYNLRLARYPGMADAVRVFREEKAASGAGDEPLALLDVGAAAGRTLQYLKAAGLDEGIRFHGIDYTPISRERLFEADRWNYRVGDVEQGLPYEDNAFDIVICEQVIEHVHRAEFVMAEIDRVLKPGGMAVLGVPTFPPGLAEVRRHIVPRIDRVTGRKRGHVQVFTRDSFIKRIENATSLKVAQVQAFRLASGGILTPLENIHGWYRFSRRTSTALSSLAIEVQAIAYKPTAQGETPPADPTRRHRLFGDADNWRQHGISPLDGLVTLNWRGMRDRLANTTAGSALLGFTVALVAIVLAASLLSDKTNQWLFADDTGMFERVSVWLWLALGVGLAAILRNVRGWAVAALAGTCLLAGVVEAGWHETLIGHGRATVAIAVAFGLATTAALFHLLRQSRGLREGWVQLLLLFLVAMGTAELFERLPGFLSNTFGVVINGTMRNMVFAFEEGVELLLPVLLAVTALALAHAQASKHKTSDTTTG